MSTCFICGDPFEKGISICCSRQCHNKRINKRDRSKDATVIGRFINLELYYLDPKLCKHCSKPIKYDASIQGNEFCNHSCSQSFVMIDRDPDIILKQKITLKKTLQDKKVINYPFTRIKFITCLSCPKLFVKRYGGSKYCSRYCCNMSDINQYRRSCKFSISFLKYPHLFDPSLLEQYGWYRASNHPKGYNPNGATWDHLFRIEDGFKLGVSPEIMSHPVNAEMMSWKENRLRFTSIITYDQLLERIDRFNLVEKPMLEIGTAVCKTTVMPL